MQKQSKLDAFLKKKHINPRPKAPVRSKHNSSREASQETVKLEDDEPEVKLEVFEKRSMLTSPAFLLIIPNCSIHFPKILPKLQKLQQNYSKEEAMAFIQGNLRFHKVENLRQLDSIDDDDFWCLTMPKLIQILLAELPKMKCKYLRLLANSSQVVDISRLEVLVLLGSMFMGIMPKQPNQDCVSFGELMVLRDNEYQPSKAATRGEKLKCIISYFNTMVKHDELFDDNIRIQRTANRDTNFLEAANMDREVPLRSVSFHLLSDRTIQDYCGKAIMVDFANKKLGGGVLRNGCVQQEILFAIFPELIITKLLCDQLDEYQAVIVYGARRFSKYTGYTETFKFAGEFPLQSNSIASKSIMVAIDALDFSKYPNENFQYSKRGIRREINKAFAGFEGAQMEADEDMPVCTGKWGCGAFRGNEDLKFIIQWLAVSEANREMIYITESEEKIREYRLLTEELARHTTLDVIGLLDEYNKNRPKGIGVLDYIKQEA